MPSIISRRKVLICAARSRSLVYFWLLTLKMPSMGSPLSDRMMCSGFVARTSSANRWKDRITRSTVSGVPPPR